MSDKQYKPDDIASIADEHITVIGGVNSSGVVKRLTLNSLGQLPVASGSQIIASSASTMLGNPALLVGFRYIGSDAVEAGSTTTVINLTAHSIRKGDIIFYFSGGPTNNGSWSSVESVSANSITLSNALPDTPTATNTITFYRPTPITAAVGSGNIGGLNVCVDSDFQESNPRSLLKLEDAAAQNGDALVGIAVMRSDTPASTTGDGDYMHPKANSLGALYADAAHAVAAPSASSLAFGSVSGTYATLVSNSSKVRAISILNTLDKDVVIGFGTTDAFYVKSGTDKLFDLAANGRWMASNLSVKTADGTSPGSGTVYGALLI